MTVVMATKQTNARAKRAKALFINFDMMEKERREDEEGGREGERE